MVYKNFKSLIRESQYVKSRISCVVVFPDDANTIEAVMRAYTDGLIQPVLIGDKKAIEMNLDVLGYGAGDVKIYNEKYSEAAICLAIDMVYGGDCQCIMKGNISTTPFMHWLLKKEHHFGTEKIVSMLSFRELPNYHKLVAFTDTGICPHPNIEQKRAILENALVVLQAMGIDAPKVAVLAASDTPNNKMPESIDAAILKRLNDEGVISGCIIEGPISMDIALNTELAARKGFESEVAGDADLLLFPDLASANLTSKAITHVTGLPPGVLLLGTMVPVIMNARTSSVDAKYLGIALAVAGSAVSVRQNSNEWDAAVNP